MRPDVEAAVALLKREGYRLTDPPPKPKPNACAKCGAIDGDTFYNPEYFNLNGIDLEQAVAAEWLTDVEIIIRKGEEGYDNVKLWFCEDHDEEVIQGLIKLGFGSHKHGGTHSLSDPECPGYIALEECPTPAKYGDNF